ncbi:MAG: hypothetical protein V1871_04075, partial [Planctomycetota bacterium]
MDIARIDPEGTAGGQSHKRKVFSEPEGTASGKNPKGEGFSERRKFHICAMDIPVRFVLVSVLEGNIIEEGSARICNINLPDWISGEVGLSEIEVSDIEIPTQGLPLKPFQVTLFIEQESLGKIHMLCSVRWISTNGTISLGLHIDQMPEK